MLKRIDITIPSDLEEPLLGLADMLGVSAFSSPQIRDEGIGETDFVYTGDTIVSFIVSEVEQNTEEILEAVEDFVNEFALDDDAVKTSEYSDNQDWMENFKQFFKPIHVGDNIVVRPPWEPPTETEKNNDTKVILIDPGMAFGTGTHETTRLCLFLLSKINVENQTFIDLGAGSGILAFYLMMRNAKSGTAIEIEGAAVENMRKNAELNNIPESLEMICADLGKYQPAIKYDGLVANITSPVIVEYLPVFSPWVKKGAWGIFSGVNTTNSKMVKDAFIQNNWEIIQEINEGDWCGFYLIKK